MGRRNYLVEGLSGTGKTSVADELRRRGHQVVHGDRELAYQGDPRTGEPTRSGGHDHHLWDVARVRALAAGQDRAATFFCGGSRNFAAFVDLFDLVLVLHVDLATLCRRLDQRPAQEWGGGNPTQRDLIVRWHRTGEGLPRGGVVIDATAPLEQVVDDILRRCRAADLGPAEQIPSSAGTAPVPHRGDDPTTPGDVRPGGHPDERPAPRRRGCPPVPPRRGVPPTRPPDTQAL